MRWSVRRPISATATGLIGVATFGCGSDDSTAATESVALPPGSSPIEPSSEAEVRVFVLDATDELALVDSQTGSLERPNGGPVFATFALTGSPDDDAEGERVSFGITDAIGLPTDDVTSAGAEIAVDGRTFHWLAEGENQRIYVGPGAAGATLAMATLNVDEATAVDVLRGAEATGAGRVSFGGGVVPDGWVDTGTSTTLQQFVAGATGSSTPIAGTRDLYGDPENAAAPSWDDINSGFGVTLSTWPVSGTDPEAEARYNLDGELTIEIHRADGSTMTGFASPADSEFTEFVVWQDGTFWLALSRPTGEPGDALADLASAVREANASEIEQLMALRQE